MTNKCSRNGCEDIATEFIDWRNPKVHSRDRVKTWASCDAHHDYFVSYLTIRGFYLGIRAIK
jgi:hypothetical protein